MEENGQLTNGTLRAGSAKSIVSGPKEYDFEDTNFYDWLWPAAKEERQMREQLTMDKLSPVAKMQGLKAAGINPLTAAGAVAGSNSTLPQPSASTNPIGDVAGAIGSAAAAVEGLGGLSIAAEKLPDEIEKLRSDSSKNFADIGLTNAQTQGVLFDNTYKNEDWKSRLNVQRQQFENMKKEYSNLEAIHAQILKDIEAKQAQIELNGSQEDYYNSLKLQVEELTRWQKQLDDFRINHKLFITDSGIDGYIFSMVESGADMAQFDKFIEEYSKYRSSVVGAEARSQYSAEADYAEAISRARKNGENASDEFYGRFGSAFDLAGKVASLGSRLTSGVLGSAVNSISDLFKSGKAKDIRNELNMILNNAYEQMELYPDEKTRLQPIIDMCTSALQLSNTELVDWWKKSNESNNK